MVDKTDPKSPEQYARIMAETQMDMVYATLRYLKHEFSQDKHEHDVMEFMSEYYRLILLGQEGYLVTARQVMEHYIKESAKKVEEDAKAAMKNIKIKEKKDEADHPYH